MVETTEQLREQILGKLKEFGEEFGWVLEDFQEVTKNYIITNKLNKAYIQTAVRGYMNRHGVLHGLTTAHYALELFRLIKEGSVESDYVKDFGFSRSQVLFALLVSGYIHDIGRFYTKTIPHEQHVSDAVELISKLAEAGNIFKGQSAITWRQVLDRTQELCLVHDQKKDPSDKVEAVFIKLADALDCSKERAYSEIDNPELDVNYGDKMRLIFSNDQNPERLFSCLSIDEVKVYWNDAARGVTVELNVKDYAAASDLKGIVDILSKCRQGSENVKKVAQKIQVSVKDPQGEYVLFPPDLISIPGGKFSKMLYEIDVENMEGDANIFSKFTLQNIRDADGIAKHTFRMWGLKPTTWEKDVKVEFCDAQGRPLVIGYDRAVDGGTGHIWTVSFKEPIMINKDLEIKGTYLWKGFFNVKADEYARIVRTPTDSFHLAIYFPREIKQEAIEAYFELKKEGASVLVIPLDIFHDKNRDKDYIRLELREQKKDFTYRVFWHVNI